MFKNARDDDIKFATKTLNASINKPCLIMSKKHLEHILPLFSLFIASLDFLFATFLLHRCFTCLKGKQLGDCSVAWHRPPKKC